MNKKVLITGGAGFIGSHLVDELLSQGYQVVVYDSLIPQVHGPGQQRPGYLHPQAGLIVGDVRDKKALKAAIQGVDVVFHLAARVGVGQSMYEIDEYTDVNNRGTAVLMEVLAGSPVGKLVVASSMSIYGEGLYTSPDGSACQTASRSLEQLRVGTWEVMDEAGTWLRPQPTPETKVPDLASVYALSKYDQEKMCLIAGRAYHIPTVALRFFNVYGTRQALSNPYTGVLAIFASRYLNDKPPLVFEDGLQQRDFVHVKDVARACRLALEVPGADGAVFNVGSGHHYTIREIADRLAHCLHKDYLTPQITGKYRVGDIRHCYSDISQAEKVLGFRPEVPFDDGLTELAEWLREQVAVDTVDKAAEELSVRGLTV
jgi:dTDP-L-rhamnose 4-epimerase